MPKDIVREELGKLAKQFEREAKRFRKKAKKYRSDEERLEALARDHAAQEEHEFIARYGEQIDAAP